MLLEYSTADKLLRNANNIATKLFEIFITLNNFKPFSIFYHMQILHKISYETTRFRCVSRTIFNRSLEIFNKNFLNGCMTKICKVL